MANNEKIKAAGKNSSHRHIQGYLDISGYLFLADNYNVLAEAPSFPDDFTANKAKKWRQHQRLLEALKKLEEINKKRLYEQRL
ncbi:hypothetical protein GCM10020331_088000 [Ectobacillus funiculus]